MKKEKFKINMHIIESCNYRCRHCFAHFDSKKMLSVEKWKHIVDNCSEYAYEINIAGGEPLIYPELMELVKYIKSKDINCSIITNGFFVDEEWVRKNSGYFSTVGFSVDSFEPDTLKKMGRIDRNQKYFSKDKFRYICNSIKKENPNCKIKMNTVVTFLNKNEILSAEIIKSGIPLSRWKILKMDIFRNEKFDNSDIGITDDEYENFLESNIKAIDSEFLKQENKNAKGKTRIFKTKDGMDIVMESNVNASYIMIDSNGKLVDDSINDNYVVVADCLNEDFSEGFKKLNFDRELYFSRY